MGLRILTGVLVPSANPGNATVHFNDHAVDGDATGAELNEGGESGDFDFPPGKVVSVRQHTGAGLITINDGPPNRDFMTVSWDAAAGTSIQEISYMIVGEA